MAVEMYCPRCAKPFPEKTLFCRKCGLALSGVREFVSGESVEGLEIATRPNSNAIKMGIGLFIFGTILGLLHTGLRDLDFYPEIYGKLAFLAFVSSGLLAIGLGYLFPTTVFQSKKRLGLKPNEPGVEGFNTSELPDALPPAKETTFDINIPKDSREPLFAEPDSVTEHTTRKLS